MISRYKKFRQILLTIAALFMPVIAFAQAPTNFREFASLVVRMVQSVIAVLFVSLAVGLVFGVVLFLANADNEKKRMEIKGYLLWGVIGIIVVMGIWGILETLSVSVFGPGAVGIPQLRPPAL